VRPYHFRHADPFGAYQLPYDTGVVGDLKRVEGSRLVINSSNFKEQMMRERIAEKFSEQGISRERLEIGYHSPPWDVMRGIDIGLDCFPHNSGTTLFESLYMGIPFITLADRHQSGDWEVVSCMVSVTPSGLPVVKRNT